MIYMKPEVMFYLLNLLYIFGDEEMKTPITNNAEAYNLLVDEMLAVKGMNYEWVRHLSEE